MYLDAFGRLTVYPSQKVNKCNYKYKLPGKKKSLYSLHACEQQGVRARRKTHGAE